jgi:topoisomerase-4 subunit B
VEFTPDPEIFPEYEYTMEFLEKRMWAYACLTPGSASCSTAPSTRLTRDSWIFYPPKWGRSPSTIWGGTGAIRIEFAFTHTNNYGEEHFSFVNGQITSDGGTHLSAFREASIRRSTNISRLPGRARTCGRAWPPRWP